MKKVTKAENPSQAIHNPVGVDSLATGVKYRTRSMMGRCQVATARCVIEQMIEQELGKKRDRSASMNVKALRFYLEKYGGVTVNIEHKAAVWEIEQADAVIA